MKFRLVLMEMEKSLYTKYRMQFESEQENVDRMHYNSVQTMKIKKDIDCYQRG